MFYLERHAAIRRRTWRIAAFLLSAIFLPMAGKASPMFPDKATVALPAEVVAFMAKRDQCDHFRGEDPGNDQMRATELERKLGQACKGTDARLKALRRQYAGNPKVMAALSHYEDDVE